MPSPTQAHHQDRHIPVLLSEVLSALAPAPGEVFIDGTFGAGGYTRAILEAAPATRVLAIDRDLDAIAEGQALIQEYEGRLTLVHGRFGDLVSLAEAAGETAVDGITFDVGVSSMQLDRADRGFSFLADGPLDMRMGHTGPDAAEIIATCTERQLADIVFHLGEERKARAIARAIVRAREVEPITRTGQLAEIVERAVGGRRPQDRIHPATRTFQALRILINDELGELARGLGAAEALLKPNGRLAVVSFHSLEDRIVKRFFAERSGHAPRASRYVPDKGSEPPSFTMLGRGVVTAGEAEIVANPRARSAKLRVAQRTDAAPFALDYARLGVSPLSLETVLC